MVINKSDITAIWIRKNENDNTSPPDTYSVDIDTEMYSINFPFARITESIITAMNESGTCCMTVDIKDY